MRTLSTTLTAAQRDISKPPLTKAVFSRAAQSTIGYTLGRILKVSHRETPDGDTVEIHLHNSDSTLTSLNFEHYQVVLSYGYATGVTRNAWVAGSTYAVDDFVRPTTANGYQYRCSVAGTVAGTTEPTWPTALGVTVADSAVTWEMDGNQGDEYSRCAPLRGRVQELLSGKGIQKLIVRPEGIVNQLNEDKAKAFSATSTDYTQTSSATATVQSLITAIAGTTIASYAGYNGYTVTYDSTDGLLTGFAPADYFKIAMNETRGSKIDELLGYTGCKMLPKNDGAIHVLRPTVSGTAFDYQYQWNVSGSHLFWNKSIRQRFVNPNQVIVQSHVDHSPSYAGTATSATSYALAPKTETLQMRLTSTAQASSIASARIESYELNAEQGFITVPMNAGQELWDYVKVTDSISGDSRQGNIQFIQRDVDLTVNPPVWRMTCSFGKLASQSLAGLLLSGNASGIGTLDSSGKLSDAQIIEMINNIVGVLEQQSIAINALETRETVAKWHVTEQLIIPVI